MADFRIRLRSVKPKSGGATLRILHTDQPNYTDDRPENWRGRLIDNAKQIADGGEGAQLDGFVIVGLWNDGRRSVGYRMSPRMPRELFPSYIAEMLRTDAITEIEAENTFDRRFEWRD